VQAIINCDLNLQMNLFPKHKFYISAGTVSFHSHWVSQNCSLVTFCNDINSLLISEVSFSLWPTYGCRTIWFKQPVLLIILHIMLSQTGIKQRDCRFLHSIRDGQVGAHTGRSPSESILSLLSWNHKIWLLWKRWGSKCQHQWFWEITLNVKSTNVLKIFLLHDITWFSQDTQHYNVMKESVCQLRVLWALY
jgi:hypothetical protein